MYILLLGLISIFLVINFVRNVSKISAGEWCEKIKKLKNPTFTNPSKLEVLDKDICIGLVLIQHKNYTEMELSFKTGVSKMMDSLFKHTDSSLHFVIVTDRQSLYGVGDLLAYIVTRMLGTHAILSR